MGSDFNASDGAGGSMPIHRDTKKDAYRVDHEADMEIREEGESSPVLYGHFNRFNEWATIRSIREGTFLERTLPGAFSKTIAESRDKMRVLFNHGHDILGQQILGPIRSLEEDETGARYEVDIFDSVPRLIMDGLRAHLYSASMRMRVLREDFDEYPKRSDHNPDGLPERTIREAQVIEFGPVTFGAYAGATSGVRSLTDVFDLKTYVGQPDLFRAALEDLSAFLKSLSAGESVEARGEANAPTEDRAEEESPHPVVVRRDTRSLYGSQTKKETPLWML